MPVIWQESYLNTLLEEAEKQVASKLNIHWTREAIAVTAGTSTYSLPTHIKRITSVTWKGEKLAPINFDEINTLGYNSAVVSSGTRNEYSQGKPQYYSLHPTNITVIRFLPTPSETISSTATDLFGTDIATKVIISFYRQASLTDTTFQLPGYVARRMKKAYALYRAFLKEGKGQNLTASAYYKEKYNLLFSYLEKINSGVYVSQKPALGAEMLSVVGGPPPPPQLPSRYPSRKI